MVSLRSSKKQSIVTRFFKFFEEKREAKSFQIFYCSFFTQSVRDFYVHYIKTVFIFSAGYFSHCFSQSGIWVVRVFVFLARYAHTFLIT